MNGMPKIEIYINLDCPFCRRAKAFLDRKTVNYQAYEIDFYSPEHSALVERSGWTSLPQIFIDGRFIGGSDDLHKLDTKGEFDSLLNADKG